MATPPSPFVSAPGSTPVRLVGRGRHLANLERAMLGVDSAAEPAPRLVIGPAGFGVTALLQHAYRRSVAKAWAASYVDVGSDGPPARELVRGALEKALAQHLEARPDSRRAPRMAEVIEGFAGTSGQLDADLYQSLHTLGPTMVDAGVGLTVFFDNAHRRPRDMAALLRVSEALAGGGRPVSLVFGGLPFAANQTTQLDVGPLGIEKVDELLAASRDAADRRYDRRAVDRIASLSNGVPFLVQTFARGAWDAAPGDLVSGDDVDRSRADAQARVLDEWYRPRTTGLDGTDIRYLKAIDPRLGAPATVEIVNKRLGDTTRLGGGSRFDDVRENLMRRGLVYVDTEDVLHHALPSFLGFLERHL